MAKTYFANIQDIKKNTLIDDNVSDKLMLVMLNEAQNRYLQQILGTNTYRSLLTKVEEDTINAVERTLIEDYILDYLYAVIELISTIDLISKFTNNGALRDNPNYSNNTALDELKVIRVSHSGNVTFTGGLIKDYILDNIESFSTYEDSEAFIAPKKVYNYGFVVYDEDIAEDEQYNLRNASNGFEEGI